jgi:hypothetical protein
LVAEGKKKNKERKNIKLFGEGGFSFTKEIEFFWVYLV